MHVELNSADIDSASDKSCRRSTSLTHHEVSVVHVRPLVTNLESPPDILRTVNFVTQALTIAVVSPFVVIRWYAKKKILRRTMVWDDCAVYAAYVLLIGYCICSLLMSVYGGGLNQWDLSPGQMRNFLKAEYAAGIIYAPMALATKLALLLLIIHIFGLVYHKTIIGVYIFISLIFFYYVSDIFIKVFICQPISSYWLQEKQNCMDVGAVITADAAISVASDLVILFLPIPLVWPLSLPKWKRLRVIALLCAGGLATAFSLYRLDLMLGVSESGNWTIVLVKAGLSGNGEIGIGLICACLPAVNGLFASHEERAQAANTVGSDRVSAIRGFHLHNSHSDGELVAGYPVVQTRHCSSPPVTG